MMVGQSNPRVRKAVSTVGPPSTKKVKPNTETSNKGSSTSPKETLTTANTVVSHYKPVHTAFEWQEAAKEPDEFTRLEIKEEAFRHGLQYADHIRSILAPAIENWTKSVTDKNLATPELMNWATRLDEIKKKDSEFRVYIGFAGVTGAGKTSAINSIIGHRDLLPSSNEAAATAVPCLIAYNEDASPGAAFKAEVTFKTEEDIRQELDEYFEVLRLREEIDQALATEEPEPEPEDEMVGQSDAASAVKDSQLKVMERLEELEMVEENSQDIQDMVSAVFGLEREDLKGESVESLLGRYPDVRSLLGRTLYIACGHAEEFSDMIKPYMDSVPAIHGGSAVEFAAWPLIVKVQVFVRSDALKNGIVLVDLPGLADNVASRALVAQKYFSKLSVTAVVAPVIRALNEQTAVNLMTENQRLCMQMDGKFHKKSFCVILSKMDDINVETYLKQHAIDASKNQPLQQCREELRTLNCEFKGIEKERSAHKQAVTAINRQRAKLRIENNKTSDQGEALRQVAKKRAEELAKGVAIERRLQLNRKQAKRLKGHILHWCIRARNAIVDRHIQEDFERRQKRLAVAALRQDLYDGSLKTFPISSSAFWKVTDDSERPTGFPGPKYTGIPALRHWLRYAAIPHREEYLDMSITALHGLFNVMQGWSSFDMQGELNLTKRFVSDKVLNRPLTTFEKTLNKAFNELHRDIKALDPLKNKEGTLGNSRQRCIAVARRWEYKAPNSSGAGKKIHWWTYSACVRRGGAVHFAKEADRRVRYAWVESLCNIFYQAIVNEWNRTLDGEIPALREPTNEMIDEVWGKLMKQLEKNASVAAPQILPLLRSKSDDLNQVKQQLKSKVKDQFLQIKMGARKAHKSVNESVGGKLKPGLARAHKETGKGKHMRQKQIVNDTVAYRGSTMFKNAAEKIAGSLSQQLKGLRNEFHNITRSTCDSLRDLIMMMLNLDGVVDNGENEAAAVVWADHASKEKVQHASRQVVAEWAARWRMGMDADVRTDAKDMAIPDTYYESEEPDEPESADDGEEDHMELAAREADNGLYI